MRFSRSLTRADPCGSIGSMMKTEQPDSRDWIPPEDMRRIFVALKYARAHMSIDGDGQAAAIECLADAVEDLATYVANSRGSRGL